MSVRVRVVTHIENTLRTRALASSLVAASLAIGGCSSSLSGGGGPPDGLGVPCGNANPDPCICGRPNASDAAAMQCDQKMACVADGGTWDPYMIYGADGVLISPPHCNPPDGGVD